MYSKRKGREKMYPYTDLILLKALFVEELHEAIMEEDKERVKYIMDMKIGQEEIDLYPITDFDIKAIKAEHEEDLKSDLSWTYTKRI